MSAFDGFKDLVELLEPDYDHAETDELIMPRLVQAAAVTATITITEH
jgi:hypothetical protein